MALRAAVRLEEVASEEVARWPLRAAVQAHGELAVALRTTVGNGSALGGAARGTAEAAPWWSLLSAMQRSQPHARHHGLSAKQRNVHADLVGWDPGRESRDRAGPPGGPIDMAHALGAAANPKLRMLPQTATAAVGGVGARRRRDLGHGGGGAFVLAAVTC